MDKHKTTQLLKPSGLNTYFCGEGLPFNEYVKQMRERIIESRKGLADEDMEKILDANSPFLLTPQDATKCKKGVLLVHGLYDSPCYVKDLGQYFVSKGFLVYGILLPGHGTVPGDLLDITYHEWIKAFEYGVDALSKNVEDVYLAGYSLGGLLALHHVLIQKKTDHIKGLLLFAPALKARSRLKNVLAKYHKIFSWISSRAKWYQVREANNVGKYSSLTFNAASQARKIVDMVQAALKTKKLNIPLFIVLTSDDETISAQEIESFFLKQPNPKDRLIVYTNKEAPTIDPRILVRPSSYPHLKIINFSHCCLTISPENILLGSQSQFCDLHHYPDRNKIQKSKLFFGAATRDNLKNHVISRLSFNPDFENLLHNIDDFLDSL